MKYGLSKIMKRAWEIKNGSAKADPFFSVRKVVFFAFLPYNGKKGKGRVTMEYRILGKTGLKISRMGFGGIPIQRIDAEGTKALMHKLLENGVNYIDTARGYTVSEEYLGVGLEGIREQFVLATKSMSRTAETMA